MPRKWESANLPYTNGWLAIQYPGGPFFERSMRQRAVLLGPPIGWLVRNAPCGLSTRQPENENPAWQGGASKQMIITWRGKIMLTRHRR